MTGWGGSHDSHMTGWGGSHDSHMTGYMTGWGGSYDSHTTGYMTGWEDHDSHMTGHMTVHMQQAYQSEGEAGVAAVPDVPEPPVGKDLGGGAVQLVDAVLSHANPHQVVVGAPNETLARQLLG